MSKELVTKNKWLLPDGSVVIVEHWEDDRDYLIGDELDQQFGGDEESYWDSRNNYECYFEKNNGKWEIEQMFHKHPDWTKSWTEYVFKNKKQIVKLSECKQIDN